MYNVIILYSGGADSRMLIEMAKDLDLNPYCVMIDYGQLHIKELDIAEAQLIEENIDYQKVKVDGLGVNSGLTGDGIQNDSGMVHSHHVPGRNSIFLSIAFSIAESKGVDTIWYGTNFADRLNLFPDCYQDYVVAINNLFKVAGPKEIKVEAPLMGWNKENIIRYLSKRGITENDMFSGYGEFS